MRVIKRAQTGKVGVAGVFRSTLFRTLDNHAINRLQ